MTPRGGVAVPLALTLLRAAVAAGWGIMALVVLGRL